MHKDTVVISIGGSILIPDKDDAVYIGKLAEMLKRASESVRIAVVCGGGKIARYYATTGRALGGSEDKLDMMAIDATRINARLLALALGDSSTMDVRPTVKETAEMSEKVGIAVMGGTEPGHTTDAVATMLAEEMGATRVVNATSVDAVYSEDPRKNPDAERYENLTIEQLGQIAERCGIDIEIVDGRNLEEPEKAILGRPFSGTHISSRRAARNNRFL